MSLADAETAREIAALEAELDRALLGPDIPWLERTFMPDAMWLHTNGRPDTAAQFLDLLRSGALVYVTRRSSDIAIRRYGDAVVVTGWGAFGIVSAGAARDLDARFTRIWVREGGRWRLASTHNGLNTVPPRTPPAA